MKKKQTYKAYAVIWFNELMPVEGKLPTLYPTKKAAQEAFGDEIIEIVPVEINLLT